jgi:hypothetical protein
MLIDPSNLEAFGVPCDILEYRGLKINLYEDVQGRQLVAVWQGKLLEFGRDNTSYRDDLKMIIDDYLDTITRFEGYPELYGSKLSYFQNADFRDVRLIYRGRLLKIYLLNSEVLADYLIQDAYNALLRYLNEKTLISN